MRKVRWLLIPILLASLLISCVQLGIGTPTDPAKMTAKQFCVFAMGVYNRQYEDYKIQISVANRTAETNKVLAQRKAVLMQVWPLIANYDMLIASGASQNKAQEAAILALLNQIGTYIK